MNKRETTILTETCAVTVEHGVWFGLVWLPILYIICLLQVCVYLVKKMGLNGAARMEELMVDSKDGATECSHD